MIDLHRNLKCDIFGALENEGILVRQEDLSQFRMGLRKVPCLPWEHWEAFLHAANVDRKGAEAFQQVARRVFHFGRQIGEAIGRLLPLSTDSVHRGARLAGVLNLGIAYYDYLADEYPESLAQVRVNLGRKQLADWWHANEAPLMDHDQYQLQFLWACIHYVFSEARQICTQPDAEFLSSEFGQSLTKMLEAENLVLCKSLQDPSWDPTVGEALTNRSVLPFWAMTQAMLWEAENVIVQWHIWQNLSSEMGHLYALVDDAKDILDDLTYQKWSLITFKMTEHGILEWPLPTDIYSLLDCLNDGLCSSSFVAELVKGHCIRLKDCLERLGLPVNARDSFCRFLGASLAAWYG